MTPEAILQAAATLLASSRNASYTPALAIRDARQMASELEAAPVVVEAASGAMETDDGA